MAREISAFGISFGGTLGCLCALAMFPFLLIGGCIVMLGSCAMIGGVNDSRDVISRSQTTRSASSAAGGGTRKEIRIDDDEIPAVQFPKFEPDLIIEKWRFTKELQFCNVAGEVTNNSGIAMENVLVVATFRTANGGFVKTAEALISFNPILPDQTSPFEVITTDNPEIVDAVVSFKYLLGGTVSAQSREKYETPTPAELAAQEEADRIKRERLAAAAQEAADRAKKATEQKKREEAEKLARIEERKKRIWTSADGNFRAEAKFLSLLNGKVELEKADGNIVHVPFETLCLADQAFIRNRRWLHDD